MSVRKESLSESVTLYLGDCREVLPTLGKVDAVVTDPPFEEEAHTLQRRVKRIGEGGGADHLRSEPLPFSGAH